ncbi:unnamed protein product [Meloidogyne enterolobii]|uniref:Uncharacterized protein n=1 Tax=Meloidogyne enterolobii TaxID=390850 RepID=A0ACB0XWA4_MELEN
MSNIFIQITFLFLLLVMPEITKSGCKSSKDSEVITPNINVSRTTDASSSSSYPNLGERITCSCGQTFYEWEEVRIGEINLIKNTIKIFHGATGQIFHAYSQQTNKCLIIKEIFLEVEDDRERTRQEWMANNELNILLYFKTRNLNERIVEIIDYGNLYEDRGKCFVMEQGNETLFRYMNDVKDRFSTINISPNGTSRRIYRGSYL